MERKYKNPKAGKDAKPIPFSSAQIREVLDPVRKRVKVPEDESVEECVRWVQWKKS